MSRKDDATALRMIPYVRKSRKSDESSSSLDEQRKMIESRAKVEGFELLPLISEDGVSGSKSWRDRELGKAIAAYQDRLSRENSQATSEVWQAMKAAGAVLIACDGTDSRAEGSELLYDIKAAVAAEAVPGLREAAATRRRILRRLSALLR